MRAAIEFRSFRHAIGIETTINVTISEACRRLTPLSRSYKARATKIKPAWPMSSPAMPRRKSLSEALCCKGPSERVYRRGAEGCRNVSPHEQKAAVEGTRRATSAFHASSHDDCISTPD